MKTKSEVPVCPNCGAKFAHSRAESRCQRCLIPDEIIVSGPRMIARWRKMKYGGKTHTTHHQSRKRNKHGRKGVKA